MNLRWPEDEAPVAEKWRPPCPGGEPLDATLECLEPEAPQSEDDPAQRILVVLAIAVLLLIGALLFWLGPLPTIFPPLDCGDCGVLGP